MWVCVCWSWCRNVVFAKRSVCVSHVRIFLFLCVCSCSFTRCSIIFCYIAADFFLFRILLSQPKRCWVYRCLRQCNWSRCLHSLDFSLFSEIVSHWHETCRTEKMCWTSPEEALSSSPTNQPTTAIHETNKNKWTKKTLIRFHKHWGERMNVEKNANSFNFHVSEWGLCTYAVFINSSAHLLNTFSLRSFTRTRCKTLQSFSNFYLLLCSSIILMQTKWIKLLYIKRYKKNTQQQQQRTHKKQTLRLRKVSLQSKRGLNLMFTFKTGCNLLKLHICLGNLDPVLASYKCAIKCVSCCHLQRHTSGLTLRRCYHSHNSALDSVHCTSNRDNQHKN